MPGIISSPRAPAAWIGSETPRQSKQHLQLQSKGGEGTAGIIAQEMGSTMGAGASEAEINNCKLKAVIFRTVCKQLLLLNREATDL